MNRAGPPSSVLAVIYLLAAGIAICVPLLPLELEAETRAAPDLLFALTAAWVLRRPDSLPLLLVLPVFLVADFLLGRPPGLWAALALLGTEILRLQAAGQNDRPFLVEWLNVALVLAAMTAATVLVLNLAFVPAPRLGAFLECYGVTLLAYPPVVLLVYGVLRVRAPRDAARWSRIGSTS